MRVPLRCAFTARGNAAVAETAPSAFKTRLRLYRSVILVKEQPSSPASRSRYIIFGKCEIIWRSHAKQVLHEVVPATMYKISSVRAALPVIHVGHEQHVELFVRSHQSVHEAHGLDRMYVVVDIAGLNQQMYLQEACHR